MNLKPAASALHGPFDVIIGRQAPSHVSDATCPGFPPTNCSNGSTWAYLSIPCHCCSGRLKTTLSRLGFARLRPASQVSRSYRGGQPLAILRHGPLGRTFQTVKPARLGFRQLRTTSQELFSCGRPLMPWILPYDLLRRISQNRLLPLDASFQGGRGMINDPRI